MLGVMSTNSPWPQDHYLPRPLDVDSLWSGMPPERRHRIGSYVMIGSVSFNEQVYKEIKGGINAGELYGTQAFEAIGAIGTMPQTYHGSDVLPDDLQSGVLIPNKALWGDGEGNLYEDESVVCFDDDLGTATFMAVIGPVRHEMKGAWRYGKSADGRQWRMVLRQALERVKGRTGCVYTTGQHKVPLQDFPGQFRSPERRSSKPIAYEFAVRVGFEDLPKNVLVVDADKDVGRKIWDLIMGGRHPLELTYLAPIEPLGGLWDVADHPSNRISPVVKSV